MMKRLLFFVLAFMLVPSVFARQGDIKLLALAEKSDGEVKGVVADLHLEIVPGRERVFLETFPLTKITTQISLRFAQQIACKELDMDCSGKDFFYTIKALPGIVGGPSAGSAAAVLTGALLLGEKIRNDTAITGTINSGGIIGPVSGLQQKIEAASEEGISRVLISKGSRLQGNGTNQTDLVEFGKSIGVEVVEVSTFAEAMEEFTGKKLPQPSAELVIDPRYQAIMRDVALDLCNRTSSISERIERDKQEFGVANMTDKVLRAQNFSRMAEEAFEEGANYASASFCFRANVLQKQALFLMHNLSKEKIAKGVLLLKSASQNFTKEIDKKDITTITDLQTYMAVKERLFEVDESLLDVVKGLNDTVAASERLGYAEERFFSAITWARFFDGEDREFVIDRKSLKDGCTAKLAEAEERINYVKSILPDSLKDTRRMLDTAYNDFNSKNYIVCLHKASKAKAEADVILSLVGVQQQSLANAVELKLTTARHALVKAQEKGIFPIIGYSYYEYAKSLKDFDAYSSLLFAEYALELSNIDIYFPKKKAKAKKVDFSEYYDKIVWALAGASIGAIIVILFGPKKKQVVKKKR